jgi:hypothetical protein
LEKRRERAGPGASQEQAKRGRKRKSKESKEGKKAKHEGKEEGRKQADETKPRTARGREESGRLAGLRAQVGGMAVLALLGLVLSNPTITPSPGQPMDLGNCPDGDQEQIYITVEYDDPNAPLDFFIQFNSQDPDGWYDLGQVTAGDWILTVYCDPQGKTDLYVKVVDEAKQSESNVLDFKYTVTSEQKGKEKGKVDLKTQLKKASLKKVVKKV